MTTSIKRERNARIVGSKESERRERQREKERERGRESDGEKAEEDYCGLTGVTPMVRLNQLILASLGTETLDLFY